MRWRKKERDRERMFTIDILMYIIWFVPLFAKVYTERDLDCTYVPSSVSSSSNILTSDAKYSKKSEEIWRSSSRMITRWALIGSRVEREEEEEERKSGFWSGWKTCFIGCTYVRFWGNGIFLLGKIQFRILRDYRI